VTHVFNDPANFDEDALAGFCRVHADLVRPVPGGVVRRHPGPKGKVAVLYGGGSGHYPVFFGLVGPGLADGAIVGNIFTSPSAHYAYSVARAAERGGGVIFTYGNYAGDVMNFGLAGEQLKAEGIDARQVIITDDVWSAQPAEAAKRRGIAGDIVVFKILSAAADTGAGIDEVERLGRLANDRTRSAGVAFTGCTLPGAAEPLFTVEAGTMGVGLGVHGEPGLSTEPLEPSAKLAQRLVDAVLAEAPVASGKIGVILNGLGATKYEELFVLWNDVAPLLEAAGYEIVDPEVGELVTSLDMAGLSLTVVWLDEELAPLWQAPHYSPAWRKGAVGLEGAGDEADDAASGAAAAAIVPGAPASVAAAPRVVAAVDAALAAVVTAEGDLGRLDAVAGDGDHGRGMRRGLEAASAAARSALTAGAGAGTVLAEAGSAWAAQAGGTSGVLWGSALRSAGAVIGDTDAPGAAAAVEAARAFTATLRRLGKAHPGDKTMLDAAGPFTDALAEAVAQGLSLEDAWRAAAQTATEAAEKTSALVPKIGRARPHAEKSVGTPDPGAVSFALAVAAAA
jgi:dihydroxyacetone kinase